METVNEVIRCYTPIPPLSTLTLDRPVVRLERPLAPHADWRRGLPGAAVAKLLARLPVLDLFRLGYLFSPTWLEVWRAAPLELHDRQFVCLPIPVSRVADAITNVLELHVGDGPGIQVGVDDHGSQDADPGSGELTDAGSAHEVGSENNGVASFGSDDGGFSDIDGGDPGRVLSFRVEHAEWHADHAARWCHALNRGRARHVLLVNRGFSNRPPCLVRFPPGLSGCTSMMSLYLAFFTVEASNFDGLERLRHLGLYGCACRHGVVECVVGGELQVFAIHHGAIDDITIDYSGLRHLELADTPARTLTVNNLPFLNRLTIGPSAPLKLSISNAPRLRELYLKGLDVISTVLVIEGTTIEFAVQSVPAEHPRMRSVIYLSMMIDYTSMNTMALTVVEKLLWYFSSVRFLDIIRNDAVSPEEGHITPSDAYLYQDLDFDDGLECVTTHLQTINFNCFRGGKRELALLKTLLSKGQVLRSVSVELDLDCSVDGEVIEAALRTFIDHVSPNQVLRDKPIFLHVSDGEL